MNILLVRHGQAVEDAPGLGDAGRWLNVKGRRVTHRVGRWIGKGKRRRPTAIWASPLVRAMQSAEIVAAASGYEGEVRAVAELSPGRDPGDLVALLALAPAEGTLLLVGHEPSLSVLATALVGDVGLSGIKKSGVVGITWENGEGQLRFVLDPTEGKLKKSLPERKDATPAA